MSPADIFSCSPPGGHSISRILTERIEPVPKRSKDYFNTRIVLPTVLHMLSNTPHRSPLKHWPLVMSFAK